MTADGLVVVIENIVASISCASKNWKPKPIKSDTGPPGDTDMKVILAVLFLTGTIYELRRRQTEKMT